MQKTFDWFIYCYYHFVFGWPYAVDGTLKSKKQLIISFSPWVIKYHHHLSFARSPCLTYTRVRSHALFCFMNASYAWLFFTLRSPPMWRFVLISPLPARFYPPLTLINWDVENKNKNKYKKEVLPAFALRGYFFFFLSAWFMTGSETGTGALSRGALRHELSSRAEWSNSFRSLCPR